MSGGCVEGAVVTEALDILATGERRVVTFGYSDDEAFAVGLTCGGTVHLFIEPLDWAVSVYDELREALVADRPVALATVIDGPGTGNKLLVGPDLEPVGTLGNEDLDRVVARDALGQLDAGRTDRRNYGAHGEAAGGRGRRLHRGVRPAAPDADLRRRRLHRRPGRPPRSSSAST